VTISRRLSAPAAERNREPIAAVLVRALPATGLVLEVASGTGQHVIHFARRMPGLIWQPSDIEPNALESTRAWSDEAALANVRVPVELDVRAERWPVERVDAVVCINMIHISEWACCESLFRGAHRAGARVVVLYGPYQIEGRTTAPSNLAFDRSLRKSNPEWGVRWLHDVEAAAARCGFQLTEIVDMPANNVTVVFSA
jgi:hypothetical protein